ncbi:MAG: flagellin N-terminal helical domain-containing protein [Phreatobacter sp.]|jgi:flagellin|uniref:flagellin N-terminal helical domain-containing protein n=1 Tax=Phreatobacter sp. TaxID=1966341 RepID=UPI004035224F
MSDIVLSKGIRGNLLSLMSTADLRDRTQYRLSTGKKVNTALDNPGNFFSAAMLNSRATDITNLLDGIGTAIKTLEAADNGIRSIVRVVENAQALARQAQGSAATTARLGGVLPIVGGAQGAMTMQTPLTDLGFANTETITINTGTNRSTTLTIGAGMTVGDLVNAINDNTSLTPASGAGVTVGTTSGADARALLSPDGRLVIEAIGTQPITLSSSNAGAALDNMGFRLSDRSKLAGELNVTRSNIAAQFSELRRQIDQLAKDAGFNGVNLLNADTLQAMFNERQTSSLTITGVRFSVEEDLAIRDQMNNFQTDRDINVAMQDLSQAMAKLRSQSSAFGSNLALVQIRQKFTQEMANTLKTGADNLVLADMNEEGANMLALQTRQQLSTQALSLANQADQSVLSLFG